MTLILATNPKLSILAREAMRQIIICFIVSRSSIGRTPDPDSGKLGSIPRRESTLDDHVAQWIEQWFPGPQVKGSTPFVVTITLVLEFF